MTLERELGAYDAMREELERHHLNEWVIIRGDEVAGYFDDVEDCLRSAIKRFGRGPYLIRQVGAPQARLPASALFGGARAES